MSSMHWSTLLSTYRLGDFAAAANSRRAAQKRPVAPWGCAAFYFALILTAVLALVYMFCAHIESSQQSTQCVGSVVSLLL